MLSAYELFRARNCDLDMDMNSLSGTLFPGLSESTDSLEDSYWVRYKKSGYNLFRLLINTKHVSALRACARENALHWSENARLSVFVRACPCAVCSPDSHSVCKGQARRDRTVRLGDYLES